MKINKQKIQFISSRVSLFLFFYFSIFLFSTSTSAQEMSSDNYKLQGGMIDTVVGTTKNIETDTSLSDTVGNSNAGIFSSKGYLINPSLVFGESSSEFSLSLSSDRIKYIGLANGKESLEKIDIHVNNGNNPGYSIYILANESPTTTDDTQVPDTVCNKSYPCSPDNAASWKSNGEPGLGYRVTGKTAPAEFDSISSYKSLPSQKRSQNPSLILSSSSKKTSDEGQLQMILRPAKNQPPGNYHNIIHIIGIPGI